MFSSDNSTPFAGETAEETFKKIQLCDYKMPDGPHVTKDVEDFISKLLVKQQSARLGADNI
jgi:hypothetical protein